jgi:hypothetical protein
VDSKSAACSRALSKLHITPSSIPRKQIENGKSERKKEGEREREAVEEEKPQCL